MTLPTVSGKVDQSIQITLVEKGNEMDQFDEATVKPTNTDIGRRGLFVLICSASMLGGLSLLARGPKQYDVPQIALTAAKELIDQGATVIDVRGSSSYNEAHLPTAALLPLEVMRESIPLWLTALKANPVVVYCGDGSTRGPEATQLLVNAGFAKPVNLTEGMRGWKNAGYKVETA
jgi:rhodanese-related sulfurtransferase